MPELPDIAAYLTALDIAVSGKCLLNVRLGSPFLLRTLAPAPAEFQGRRVTSLRRIGKRIAIGVEGDLWLVLHLMIAGRLHWRKPAASISPKGNLLALDFESGCLTMTEAGTKRRASLHLLQGEESLHRIDPGGVEPLEVPLGVFRDALLSGNHTLKRALTDPHKFSGIGNSYSDEILHAARLSPVALTSKLTDDEIARLHGAARTVLFQWTRHFCEEARKAFPEKVTAFREGMAVHGRYGSPCPICSSKVARIRFKDNETNYCPRCQTGGRLLADRSLSRLLGKDWPRSIDELE
jgi:formamidopyrimidine-DNA glycosylase